MKKENCGLFIKEIEGAIKKQQLKIELYINPKKDFKKRILEDQKLLTKW